MTNDGNLPMSVTSESTVSTPLPVVYNSAMLPTQTKKGKNPSGRILESLIWNLRSRLGMCHGVVWTLFLLRRTWRKRFPSFLYTSMALHPLSVLSRLERFSTCQACGSIMLDLDRVGKTEN